MAHRRRIGTSTLEVFPLALGTNVFGWTADEGESHHVLDRFVAAGGNFVDSADSYSAWVPGNSGGESERIIGSWLATRSREDIVLATKVSQHPDFTGLSPANVKAAIDASLSRLRTDVVDLYYAHYDDPSTPLEETAAAFSDLVDQGKIRYIGVSNYSPERIREWLEIAARDGLHLPVAVQPQYSLVERGVEQTIIPIAADAGLSTVPYYALAKGFLTGKYRSGAGDSASPRAGAAAAYLEGDGPRVLTALDEVAEAHSAPVAAIALAWLAGRPTVVAPLASARTVEQLPALLAHADIELTAAETDALDAASGA